MPFKVSQVVFIYAAEITKGAWHLNIYTFIVLSSFKDNSPLYQIPIKIYDLVNLLVFKVVLLVVFTSIKWAWWDDSTDSTCLLKYLPTPPPDGVELSRPNHNKEKNLRPIYKEFKTFPYKNLIYIRSDYQSNSELLCVIYFQSFLIRWTPAILDNNSQNSKLDL